MYMSPLRDCEICIYRDHSLKRKHLWTHILKSFYLMDVILKVLKSVYLKLILAVVFPNIFLENARFTKFLYKLIWNHSNKLAEATHLMCYLLFFLFDWCHICLYKNIVRKLSYALLFFRFITIMPNVNPIQLLSLY